MVLNINNRKYQKHNKIKPFHVFKNPQSKEQTAKQPQIQKMKPWQPHTPAPVFTTRIARYVNCL